MQYKIGSLFDGSGGFPLAGALCGVEPRWASEVEPYPIAVTRTRFPKMRHLGDISKIHGGEIEPVDIITFGSPCQDLSVAGKRAGLKHEANGDEETTRSGLFMEAVRIIKEMREATNDNYPTFALWENVPGAFSSNKGEDFRIVLEELVKIVEPRASMPEVPKNGWPYADSYIGNGWSLAYRVFDAQYWGVPQRRRRIHLVLDLRGERAREVLFERDGVRGYFTQGRTPWQGIASNAQGGTGANDSKGEGAGAGARGLDAIKQSAGFCPEQSAKTRGIGYEEEEVSPTLRAGVIPGVVKIVCAATQQGGAEIRTDDRTPTITAAAGMSGNNQPYIAYASSNVIAIDKESYNSGAGFDREPGIAVGGPCAPLRVGGGGQHAVCYMFENHSQDTRYKGPLEVAQTVSATYGMGGNNQPFVVSTEPSNFIDVEMEVAVRKYEVDKDKLVSVLRAHKGKLTNREIAEKLNRPLTLVEHWFRTDNSFAVPDPGVWYDLKRLLGIETTEFDQSVTEFEFKSGNYDMRNRIYTGDTSPTLTCGCGDHLHLLPGETVYCLQGNGIGRKDENGCAGKGYRENESYTLNTIDRPAVAYAEEPPICVADHPTPKVDTKGISFTLNSRDYKAPLCAVYPDPPHYIVRRLTPTECARLQGFADRWGDIEKKTDLTDEEYTFWLEVRNTHAAINGKAVKDYTKKAMLTWYNKLQTDSAEYKMWGNGIALPPALYCMRGMVETLDKQTEEDDDSWMD